VLATRHLTPQRLDTSTQTPFSPFLESSCFLGRPAWDILMITLHPPLPLLDITQETTIHPPTSISFLCHPDDPFPAHVNNHARPSKSIPPLSDGASLSSCPRLRRRMNLLHAHAHRRPQRDSAMAMSALYSACDVSVSKICPRQQVSPSDHYGHRYWSG
jgi:hypothetical protein